jgi:hypothetical protein
MGPATQQIEHALIKSTAPIGGDRSAGRAHGIQNEWGLNFDHFKVFFARTAFGKSSSWGLDPKGCRAQCLHLGRQRLRRKSSRKSNTSKF